MANDDFLNNSGGTKTASRKHKDDKVITDTNLKDSDLRENPYNTEHGQEIVSISETFWNRLFRQGRHRNAFSLGVDMPIDNTYAYGAYVKASTGTIFYPRFVTVSSSVDAELVIVVSTGVNLGDSANSGTITHVSYCKAGQPFCITFDGDIYALENKSVEIRGRTTATGGKLYGSVHGIEVSINA